jgi:serine/threonine-protein kinase
MSDFSDPDSRTTDSASVSLEEQARQRFLQALEESRHGGPPPDLNAVLAPVPEPARSWLREELESLQRSSFGGERVTVPDRKNGETRNEPPAPGGGTLEYVADDLPILPRTPAVEPLGTVDYANGDNPAVPVTSPHQETVKPPPADTFGTTDYEAVPSPPSPPPSAKASDPYARAKKKGLGAISVPKQVAGYEILDVLGRGAMGVVYKARQPGLKRLVALKMILAGEHASEKELARFKIEAEAVAQLQHPNIIGIYQIGDEEGRPFFSLEYVDGGSLTGKIDNTPQPPREAARMVQILAQGMEAAHQRGIIHRDLKPANILLAADGTPKITDFGLAKKLEEDSGQTRHGAVLGTPSYMAPEQAEGHTDMVGPLSDVYSLGAILYEMLTGRAPFKAGSVLDTLQQVKTQEPVAPIQFAPSVPRDLETICLKCLQKDPARRYASAGALADDLGRFLDGRPILARPVSTPERVWRWCKRNPRAAGVTVGILLGIAFYSAIVSALAVSLKRQKDQTETAKNEAVANAERADKNAETAKNKHQLAVHRMIELGERVQQRVSARRFGPDAAPELRGVRGDMLHLLRDSMVQMAKDIEGAEVTESGMVAAYQQLGDLLKKIGQGEEAMQQFRQGYEISKQVAADKPDSDRLQANKGVMLRRLGDMALELNGDVKTARANYQEAYDIQKAILEHPKSNDYAEADKRRLLSQCVFGLGKIELAAGELASARRNLEEALVHSRLWLEAVSAGDTSAAESWQAGNYLYLGVVADRSGNADEAKRNFEESLRITTALADRYPKNISYKADLAEIYAFLGDFQMRAGLVDYAAKSYGELRKNLGAVLNFDKEDLSRQQEVAHTHARVAALALRQNNPDEAKFRHQEALKIWEDLTQTEPSNMTWRAAYAVALARAGKGSGARKQAAELCQRCPQSGELLLQAARCHAICAAMATDPAEKKRCVEAVLTTLKQVADTGWKDARLIDSDPELAVVRTDAGYPAVLSMIRKRS